MQEAREHLFSRAEKDLRFSAEVYSLGEKFEGLPSDLASIRMLDVTKVPGCHYGLRNIFVPIIHHLEENGVNPDNSILVEPSTGNGFTAFSDAATYLGYEHVVVMPDGLPEARYKHPLGRDVKIIRTPAEDYASGMPIQMSQMVFKENIGRAERGEKRYVSPNHANSAGSITVKAMSELGSQLLSHLKDQEKAIRVVVSMGNGASLCALGEYVKELVDGAKVVATESFAYGGGYDQFVGARGLRRYKELFGIDPGHPSLMAKFSTFGTNAPIGIEMPLQKRAMSNGLIDDYLILADNAVLEAYEELHPEVENLKNARTLPNYSQLPRVLYDRYGNSTLANIAAARRFTNNGELVVAMAYDGRENY